MNYKKTKIAFNINNVFVVLVPIIFLMVGLQMYFSYQRVFYSQKINIAQNEIYDLRHKMLQINNGSDIASAIQSDEITHIVVIEKSEQVSVSLSR